MMIGRYEVFLNGHEYTAWEDADGMIGVIERDEPRRVIWPGYGRLRPTARKVVKAMGIEHLISEEGGRPS
jgi:hypothetical protein